ncbi:MAG TPA: A24 family peptidase [Dermatophilaceae bacterium]|jgi:Flp pilus assembly protein protease CpaA
MNVAVGAVAGVAVTPLVYWAATRMLNTAVRIPRTPEAMVVLTAACAAADAAVATLTGPITITAYAVFAFGVLTAAVVDAVERRIPNRITYPLLAIGVLGLPGLTSPITGWTLLAPVTGAVVSGCIGLLNAVFADQGLGDVKLATVIGAWMAHLGLLPWITGLMLGQILMIAAISGNQLRRRWAGLPRDHTPLGPSLAGGAVLAVAVAGLAF